MKKILGLDLGTNSIGWAVVNADETNRDNETKYLKPTEISAAGSRIIPMSADILGEFEKGNSVSQTAERTGFRGTRRLLERNLLRRERLLRVLQLMNFLPEHYATHINRYGKFTDDSEPKLPWCKNEQGKYEFIFQESFNEMLADFTKYQPQIVADGKKVPYDWTIYYLRKKALTEAITKEELAWILLQFNQKRGYYQLRGEDEEENTTAKTRQYFDRQIISDIVDTGQEYKGLKVLTVILQNGDKGKVFKKEVPNWIGQEKSIIVTVDIDKDGHDKFDENGQLSRKFKIPTEAEWDSEWKLIKLKTEKDLDNSHKTVGYYIYDNLLQNPNQKIIGKLVRTIERKFYKEELRLILEKQKEFIPELRDENLYLECINELYQINEAHRNNIAKPDFTNLFINDILFYQRPLKSKKSLISDCPYESRFDKDGTEHPVKCIAKSNPLFQEFRLWQFVQNLKIYQREKIVSDGQLDLFGNQNTGKLQTDVDVTAEFLTTEDDYVKLFEWLNDRANIKQDTLLNSYFKIKKAKGQEKYPYRWNYVEDKEYPCNETRNALLSALDKCGMDKEILSHEIEIQLWHILYSVEDKIEIGKALETFAKKNSLESNFAETFKKIKPFKKEYGSYSEKAIKKLLPLMRMGKYWNADKIDDNTKKRIEKIISGEFDENIMNRVREKAITLTELKQFKGLPTWLACYIVYDRHSEAKEIEKWEKPEDIDNYLKHFKQHSLRNPIVEQVITETLRTVRDIWKQEGQIDEIHIELGRDMKNPADKRKKMTERIQQNENTNMRIKALLMEFASPEMEIDNVRPHSPSQQDILRIYEENALDNLSKDDKDYDFISKISKTAQPSKSDIIRYKCWLEQKYHSPYTGEPISLSKLFTSAYEIEHVIPQSRYFDDSFSNKVICEAEVNKLKDRQLGYEFIKNHHGQKVQLSLGKTVEILSVDAYERFIKENYSNNPPKMKKLLMDDIPDGFIERQLNDSRYISKVVKGLLSNIVREKLANGEYEQEAVSKNLISCNGTITDYLKKDWGINDVWNRIILPRFERMNKITGKDCFTTTTTEGHLIPNMPFELSKGFNKKRIDHRHHAMDAIVIACTTRDHVNLLNNEAAQSKNNANRYQLSRKLRRYEKVTINGKEEREVPKKFIKPWDSFTTDVQKSLENIIVSFKQNLRIINKTTNHSEHFEDGKKILVKQKKGDSWAIRKPMHKDTVFGEVNLRFIKAVSLNEALKHPERIVNKDFKLKIRELLSKGKDAKFIKKYLEENKDVWSDINVSKIDVYYFTKETKERFFATRKSLDPSFDKKTIEDSVTDTGIKKILLAHLASKDNNPELAFSPDGIDEMNRNIIALNNGKFHQPIIKVRKYEKADKFAVGQNGNKSKKFVEAAKGTNLFFAIFVSEKENKETGEIEKIRSYLTIPLNTIIDCQKKFGTKWNDNIENYLKDKELVTTDAKLLFIISPNDLVYLPTKEEKDGIQFINKKRIYKLVSCTGNEGHFIPEIIASPILQTIELGSNNKAQKSWTGEMIKETCVPIKVDRLGNIIEINGKKL
jgi:CRISPR-associated endonuclease Csn1